jgi:hypothetical protein
MRRTEFIGGGGGHRRRSREEELAGGKRSRTGVDRDPGQE